MNLDLALSAEDEHGPIVIGVGEDVLHGGAGCREFAMVVLVVCSHSHRLDFIVARYILRRWPSPAAIHHQSDVRLPCQIGIKIIWTCQHHTTF